jgi:AraC-like DNA-binding protein
MEFMDLDIDWKSFYAVGLSGTLEDFSTEKLHMHPFHQVLHIKNGVALIQDACGTRPQYGHMAVFIPAHVRHRTEVIGDAVAYQSLYFNESLLTWNRRTILPFEMSPLGFALLERINKEEPLRNLDCGIARDCVDLFLKVLPADMKNEGPSLFLPELHSEPGRKVRRFIERNYRRKITSADVSRAAASSFRQVSRVFKADTGLTVFEYLRVYRMLRASIGISMTDAKITAIAYDCGYESISSFFTDFRKLFGLSPDAFRRRRR